MATLDPRSIPRPAQVAAEWAKRRTFSADEIPPGEILQSQKRAEGMRISVCIPARDDAATIGPTCRRLRRELMLKVPLIDELVVLDADSRDDTVLQARSAGADVKKVSELISEVPVVEGRGDALWRSLTAMTGDVIVWLDPGIESSDASVVVERLIAPLLLDPTVGFVKGYYERPVEFDVVIDGVVYYAGNGRLTEFLVRPLLNILFPELGGFFDPLAASYAGRIENLRQIPFFTGWSGDVATLIDLLDVIGLEGMAQADLGKRCNREQPLNVLGPRGHAIARTILKRAEERKRIKLAPAAVIHPLLLPAGKGVDTVRIDEIERPPIDMLPPYLAALKGRHPARQAARRPRSSISV